MHTLLCQVQDITFQEHWVESVCPEGSYRWPQRNERKQMIRERFKKKKSRNNQKVKVEQVQITKEAQFDFSLSQ